MRAVSMNDIDEYRSVTVQQSSTSFSDLRVADYARWGILFLDQLEKAAPE